jgi:signal transduction histidine kinase
MNRRRNAALILIVLAPVVLMGWLGLRSVRLEQGQMQARLEAAALRLLSQYDAALQEVVVKVEQGVLPLLGAAMDTPDRQRELVRASRYIRQPFVFDADGALVVPNPESTDLVERERFFLERTAAWRRAGNVFVNEEPGGTAAEPVRSGWYTWFWEDGIQFVLWRRMEDGSIHGVELDRYALLAEVIAALPHTRLDRLVERYAAEDVDEYIALRDPRGDILYAWGAYLPESGMSPWAVRPLSGPLAAWQLSYYSSPLSSGAIPPAALGLLLVILAVTLAMVAAVCLFVREHSRAMREAQQRVSFVNQVSHELKTPLTNIRMYTELLEQRIAGKDVKAEQYTGILLSESRRLGRMIHNVLSFGQQGRGALRLHRAMGELDEAVGEVLEHFRPAFERREMQVVFTPGSPGEVLFDRDALEQILGNLLGNAEKYAGEGAAVRVVTRRAQERVVLDVEDNGPGIPDKYREEIFKPFFRLDARLTQQASGAGIGLSIARDLARLHGGDLVLVPTEKGALFRVTLG